MAKWFGSFRRDKSLAVGTIAAGLLLISSRLLLEHLALAQPQCAIPLHPHIRSFVEKSFELLDKIGDACVIAGLIGIVVDEGLKTKFIQEVVRSASPRLIGQHLPEPIRVALLNYFKINFVRPDWEIEYEITKVDDLPGFIRITSRIQGPVQNYSSETEEYTLISSVDPAPKEIAPREALITRVSLRPESGVGGFDEFPPDNAMLLQPDGTKLFMRSLPISPGQRFKTVLEALEFRSISSVMPLFTGTAVVKATVRIRYPKDLLDIQVSTGASTNFQPEPTLWGAEWEIPIPLVPGQCILATWNPRGRSAGTLEDGKGANPAPPVSIDAQPLPLDLP